MGEAVESLVTHPGWAHVQRLVEAEIAEIDRALDAGDEPLTQAQYAIRHGRRGGLLASRDAAETILARYRAALEHQRAKHENPAESGR